jgi:hypothetical protein
MTKWQRGSRSSGTSLLKEGSRSSERPGFAEGTAMNAEGSEIRLGSLVDSLSGEKLEGAARAVNVTEAMSENANTDANSDERSATTHAA